jgi:hypothetical protein
VSPSTSIRDPRPATTSIRTCSSRSSLPYGVSFAKPALCGATTLARYRVSPTTCADITRCLFALCMDRGLGPCQFVDLFVTPESDLQLETAFVREFGHRHPNRRGGIRGGQCCTCRKGECLYPINTVEGGENGTRTYNSVCFFVSTI